MLLVASPASATIYYIDYSGGSDSNNGTTTGTPWQHCPGDRNATSNALGKTPAAGDVFIFKGGVVYTPPTASSNTDYDARIKTDWSGTGDADANRIIYDGDSGTYTTRWAAGNTKAIIDGGGTGKYAFSGQPQLKSYITINNFEIRNMKQATTWSTFGVYFADPSHSVYGANTGIKVTNNYIHDVGYVNPNNYEVNGSGVIIYNPNSCTVSGNEITGTGNGIMFFNGGTNSTIQSNNIHGPNIQWGIDIAVDGANISGHTIKNNTIHDLYDLDAGFWAGTGDGPHTDFIFIRDNGQNYTVTNFTIDSNLFYNNYTFTNNGGTAMIYSQTSKTLYNNFVFSNNIFINPHSYYALEIGGGNKIYNNTFYTPRSGPMNLSPNGAGNPGNFDIKNNIIMGGANPAITWYDNSASLQSLSIDYNVYYDNTASPFMKANSPYTTWTWAQWQALGYDTHSIGETAIATIKFVDTSSYPTACQNMNLRLQSGSPAIDVGTTVSISNDYGGTFRPQNSIFDIGAYEYFTGTQSPHTVTPSVASGSTGLGTTSPSSAYTVLDAATTALTLIPIHSYKSLSCTGTCTWGAVSNNICVSAAVTGDCTGIASFTYDFTFTTVVGTGSQETVGSGNKITIVH